MYLQVECARARLHPINQVRARTRGPLCMFPLPYPWRMRVQQGEDGSNATVGMVALRRVLLGYLNVSTLDCAPGE